MRTTLVDIINSVIAWTLGIVNIDYEAILPEVVRDGIGMILACAVIIAYVAVTVIFWVWAERRVAGRIQSRQGPNRVGPFGLLQCVADGIKLLIKEDIVPQTVHPFLFRVAPILVFMGALAPFVVLPFSRDLVVSHMSLGIYFALSFLALEVVGIIMSGWASHNKWSLYGGMRLAAQMMSYEIPMGLAVLSVVILTESLRLGDIVTEQSKGWWILGWNIFRGFPWLFIAMFIFYIGGLASSKRTPFDLPEAESELVAGFHTEYSGMRFAIFFLSEYAAMYVISILTAILFLGGWHGPIPAPSNPIVANLIGMANLIGKTWFLLFVMLWLRWTFPRVRIDHIIYICLKVFVPFGLVCVGGAAVWALLFQG